MLFRSRVFHVEHGGLKRPVRKFRKKLIRLPVDPAVEGFAFPVRLGEKFIGELARFLVARFDSAFVILT